MSGDKGFTTGQPIALNATKYFRGGDVDKLQEGLVGQIVNIINSPEDVFLMVVFPDYMSSGVFAISAKDASPVIHEAEDGRKGVILSVDFLAGNIPTSVQWEDGTVEVLLPEETEE